MGMTMQQLASIQPHNIRVPARQSVTPASLPLSLVSACEVSPIRKSLETFISNGFATAFNADIHHFLPLLVGVKTTGIRAALGLRSATSPLFLEQYLDAPIERVLASHDVQISRQSLVEIGNLFSASSRYTLPLLLGVSAALYVNNIEYVVFSATQSLRALFLNNKLPLVHLADADPAKLSANADSWGSYYDTAPQVMALKLSHVVTLMLRDPNLLSLYSQMTPHMPAVYQQVRCLA